MMDILQIDDIFGAILSYFIENADIKPLKHICK